MPDGNKRNGLFLNDGLNFYLQGFCCWFPQQKENERVEFITTLSSLLFARLFVGGVCSLQRLEKNSESKENSSPIPIAWRQSCPQGQQ